MALCDPRHFPPTLEPQFPEGGPCQPAAFTHSPNGNGGREPGQGWEPQLTQPLSPSWCLSGTRDKAQGSLTASRAGPFPLSLFPGPRGPVPSIHFSGPCLSWACLMKSIPSSTMDPSSHLSPAAGPTTWYRLPKTRAVGSQLLTGTLVPSLRAHEWSPMPSPLQAPQSPRLPSPALWPLEAGLRSTQSTPAAAGWVQLVETCRDGQACSPCCQVQTSEAAYRVPPVCWGQGWSWACHSIALRQCTS